MAQEAARESRIDHLFSAPEARLDRWRDLHKAVQRWAAKPSRKEGAPAQAECVEAMAALVPLEDFNAYPGPRLIGMLRERLESGDAMGTARLIERISMALMTRSYRRDPVEWEAEEDTSGSATTMPTATSEAGSRPYFEVLVVTPTPASKWQLHIQQMRRLRRTQDAFVYEPVFVGSFEDAILGVALNANVQ